MISVSAIWYRNEPLWVTQYQSECAVLEEGGSFWSEWPHSAKLRKKPQTLCVLNVLGRKGGGSVVAAAKAKVLVIATADLLYGSLPLQENSVN